MAASNKTNPAAKKKKKRRVSRFQLALVLFIAIVAVSAALAVLLLVRPSASGTADKPAVFSVHAVEVEGETRYDPQAIISASGIRVGQSLFSVNKVKAHDAILQQFPYIERVEVGNASFDTVKIRVWEVEPIGAMYAGGQWLVVGSNNKGVEALPVQGDRPNRYLYFKGAEPADGKVGGKAMQDRDIGIVNTLLASMEKHGLTDIVEIDLSEKTNIKLNWKNQITIYLGNETNLDYEIGLLVSVLPDLLQNNGANAAGVFDLRSYSDDDAENDKGIFTPADVLASRTTAAAAGTTGTGTTGTGTTGTGGGTPGTSAGAGTAAKPAA